MSSLETLWYAALPYRKGIGLIFPNPDVEIGPSRGLVR
jgi:hypothetical protein